MDYNHERWIKCRECGSLYPAQWDRCGRCGQPRKTGRRAVIFMKLLLLALLLIGAYAYKDKLLALLDFNGSNEFDAFVIERDSGGIVPAESDKESVQKAIDTPEPSVNEATAPPSAEPSQGKASTSAPTAKPAVSSTPAPTAKPSASQKPVSAAESQYNLIRNALMSADDRIVLSSKPSSQEVFDMIEKIVLSEPLIQFYEGCSYRSDGLLTFKYSKSADFIRKANNEVKQKAQQITSSIIKTGMSDFEKELAVHDYIIKNTRYDIENLEAGTIPPESHNTYGALVLGKAVCEGYAKAAKLLMGMAGIESMVVTGDSEGQSHAWNLVKIGGDWYHLDPTWDDPVTQSTEGTLQYTYFNLTDREMRADHTWNAGDYPKCESKAYNYFTYLNKVVNSPDMFVDYLVNEAEKGNSHISVRITDYSAERYNMPNLIRKAATRLGTDASYSVSESFGVVQVWFGG